MIDLEERRKRFGRLAGLIGLLLGYVVVLPWLGQIVSSMVFCAVLMRVLSGLGWTRVVVYSAMVLFLSIWVLVFFAF